MSTDEAEFAAYMVHPDTNRAAFEALFDQAMANSDYAGTMKVISVIMSEVASCPTTLTELSA